jgi:hypothetical protein
MKAYFLVWVVAAATFAAELPVREVILYKHGVGYFERAGELRPGETAKLEFKAEEMNDVLKSLTIQDKNGGKVSGVRYDSSEPLAQKMGEFPFVLDGQNPALSAFLNQLKGAKVSLKFASETLVGSIMGARLVAGDDKHPEREQMVLLTDAGQMRTVDLSAATSVDFVDPILQTQLREYLRVLSDSRSKERRNVYVDSVDSGTRQLSASYMIPMAVWKSSYRLIFGDAAATLEGWAIIDNTTAEDWTKVKLSLVSGRPISFISKLYDPKYIVRREAELAEDRSVGPEVYEGGVAGGVIGGIVAGMPAAAPPAARMMAPQSKSMAALSGNALREQERVDASSAYVNTQGRDLGELFEYSFGTPVTVRKGESAMFPFLQQKITARKLLIYSGESSQNPLNATEITNNTGKTLDGGPITVFDGGTYAGEALVETVKAADKRLISYAVDLGTRITTKYDSHSEGIREIHANRGTLTTRSAQQETKTYTIRNVDAKTKTLIIQTPQRYGFKVLNQKPVETTASANRFEVKLPANGTETYPIVEEHDIENSMAVINMNPNVLYVYTRNKAISDAGKKQLERIAQQKQQIADNDGLLSRTQTDIDNLNRDQERVRQNIGSLNQVAGQQDQVQKYAQTLAAQESKLAGLRDRQTELKDKKSALEAELNALIEKLEF